MEIIELKSEFVDYHKDRTSDIILSYYLTKDIEIGFNTKDFIPNHIILNEGDGDFAIIGELEIDDQVYINGDYYSEELAKKLGISEEELKQTIADIKARAKNDAIEELKDYLKEHPEEIPEISYRGY